MKVRSSSVDVVTVNLLNVIKERDVKTLTTEKCAGPSAACISGKEEKVIDPGVHLDNGNPIVLQWKSTPPTQVQSDVRQYPQPRLFCRTLSKPLMNKQKPRRDLRPDRRMDNLRGVESQRVRRSDKRSGVTRMAMSTVSNKMQRKTIPVDGGRSFSEEGWRLRLRSSWPRGFECFSRSSGNLYAPEVVNVVSAVVVEMAKQEANGRGGSQPTED